MIIPDKVSILGIDYDVMREELETEEGYISPKKQRIVLCTGLSSQKEQQVFLHEVVHGLFDQLGYSELYEDEHLVQGLAIGLHQMLADV